VAIFTERSVPNRKPTVSIDESEIDTIFAHLNQCHLPGAAIGIAVEGRPVYRKAFGVASSELPVGLSPSIKMRIGSTTKHFTSLAYLLQCEKGSADIDDPIGKYLPELHPVSRSVTVRQLMTHVSGIRDVFDICWQLSGTGRHVSSSELLSLYKRIDDVNAAPGTSWIYNNGGYLLLSAAIERIANQPFEEVLQETIFKPVGMYDTALRRFDTDFVPNSATLHMPTPDRKFEKAYLGAALAGEGGVVSTVNDMLLWLRHMDFPEIGSTETWSIMRRPQALANGTSTGYGLGLVSGQYRGLETVGHAGSVLAGSADMLKVLPAALDVVILVNRGDVSAGSLTKEILDTCLNVGLSEETPELPFATGIFRSKATGRIVQLLVRDGQQIASVDGTEILVTPDTGGVLHPSSIYSILRYSITLIGGTQRPAKILFDDFGNRDELSAVRSGEGADAQSIAGRYRSDSIDSEVAIYPTEGGASMKSIGQFGSVDYRLQCLTDSVWRSSSTGWVPWAGLLFFDSDNRTFGFTNLRTRKLRFRRVH
jgi:D-aminopeptidase